MTSSLEWGHVPLCGEGMAERQRGQTHGRSCREQEVVSTLASLLKATSQRQDGLCARHGFILGKRKHEGEVKQGCC